MKSKPNKLLVKYPIKNRLVSGPISISKQLELFNFSLNKNRNYESCFIDYGDRFNKLPGPTADAEVDERKTKHLDKNLPNDNMEDQNVTLHTIMKAPLFVGQFMGLFCLHGIIGNNIAKLRFTLNSILFFYTIIVFSYQVIATVLSCYRVFRIKFSITFVSYVIFFGSVALTTALFLRIALRWPHLIRHVAKSERVPDNFHDPKLKLKCLIATVLIISLGFVDHILSEITKISEILWCDPEGVNVFYTWSHRSFPWFFELYSPESTIVRTICHLFLEFMNIQSALNMSYPDLFIICLSYYLVSRLEKVYMKLKKKDTKEPSTEFWRLLREEYNGVVLLVQQVNDVISGIIFVSFASNLFFICLQLYNILSAGAFRYTVYSTKECKHQNPNRFFDGNEHKIYFGYSLAFLLLRSLAASLIAAKVHMATLVFAPELYNVPSSCYCDDIQRFLDQLHGEKVALTGLDFFKVTRSLILSVAGTVVTYELVLLQLDNEDKK